MSLHCGSHVISPIDSNQESSGATASFPHIPIYLGDTNALDVREADCQQVNQATAHHEGSFRTTFESFDSPSEWRSDAASPADFLTTEARAVDLLIVCRHEKGIRFIPNQSLDIGDAIIRAGRPMLVVPPRKSFLALNRILIAWKDSAEAGKAVAAASAAEKRSRRDDRRDHLRRARE